MTKLYIRMPQLPCRHACSAFKYQEGGLTLLTGWAQTKRRHEQLHAGTSS
jgi:hypothetical protein